MAVLDAGDAVDSAFRQHGAQWASVRDNQDTALRVAFSDSQEGFENPRDHRLLRLAVAPGAVARVWEASEDLLVGEPLPGTEVSLPKAADGDHVEPARIGDETRGLLCAHEVARVDRVERLAGELCAERSRLRAASVVQRRVGVPLDASIQVPVGLAVPRKEDSRHRRIR